MARQDQNLEALLSALDPVLDPELYVFGSISASKAACLDGFTPRATFQEDEGFSVILSQVEAAKAGLPQTPVFQRITLRVYSSLEAVGLTAAVSECLAERGISSNVVAATHHDHVFVPAARADEALKALRALSALKVRT